MFSLKMKVLYRGVFYYLPPINISGNKRGWGVMGICESILIENLSILTVGFFKVTSFGEILQLVIVELIYKVCYANPPERARFIRCVYNLLQSSSLAVRYEAAGTLVTLSNAPTAIRV